MTLLLRRSAIFPAPTLVNGQPQNWQPTSVTEAVYGSYKVVINGTDVTMFRGVPCQIETLSWADPFGPERATIVFPQITPFDTPGTGDLAWLVDHASVQVQRLQENGLPVNASEYEWWGLYIEEDDKAGEKQVSFTLNAFGSLYQTSLYQKRPENTAEEVDVGELLFRALWPRLHKAYRFTLQNGDDLADPAVDAPVLGVNSNYYGNWEGLDEYMQKLLQLVPDWTVALSRTNEAQIVARKTDVTTFAADWTARCNQPGVTHDFVRSLLLSPNAIYGRGTDDTGSQWTNIFAFDDGTPQGTVFYQPIAYDPEVNPYDEVGGDLVIDLGRLDETKIKHESTMDFGQGVSITPAKFIAEDYRLRMATPGFSGTIEFAADPNEGSRLDMRPNQVLLLQNHRGADRKFFIARVEIKFGRAPRVTVHVDEKARTAQLLDALMEGLRNRVRNPVPQLLVGRRPQEQSAFLWDRAAGSGQIPNDDVVGRRWLNPAVNRVHCLPSQWTTYRFFASERDTIISTYFDVVPACRFHVSIYNIPPDPLDLPTDPFGDGAWDEPPDGFIIGWGSYRQGAGYYPGFESGGSPLTGVMKDDGTWQYSHDDVALNIKQPAFLWIAVWPTADTYIGGELLRGIGQQV